MFSTTLALLSQIEHEKAYLCTLARPYELAGQQANVPGKPPFSEHFNASLLSRGSKSDVRAIKIFRMSTWSEQQQVCLQLSG